MSKHLANSKTHRKTLKPANILIHKDLTPAIADLGESRFGGSEDAKMTVVGTPGYTAPEILRGVAYGQAADVYSFGILMAEVMTMRAPYSSVAGRGKRDWQAIHHLVITENLRPDLDTIEDKDLVKLARLCWDDNPRLRPRFPAIHYMLEVSL